MKGEEIEEIEREEEGGNVGGESVRVKDEREREMRRRQSLIERYVIRGERKREPPGGEMCMGAGEDEEAVKPNHLN